MTPEEMLQQGFEIYKTYRWLINSYVLDFFTEQHWSKLPESWKCMEELSTNQVAELLDHDKNSKTFIFPLSILALKVLFLTLNISRLQQPNIQPIVHIENDEKLMKIFWKSVKLKKDMKYP
ncbi:hypothetical protein HHI36_023322 [Cryptolaemus montrouzieri]|uniref:Uncharacterized protein n=1 Tax=Cryptolaemus montrouzieri TaxID=559131 RepID=A0ABD2PG03_9CUCU